MFSGVMPGWAGGSVKLLLHLRLQSNMFSGRIPSELGQLRCLRVLDLSNYFFGPIPDSIGNLSSLYNLNLSKNQLVGEITKKIGNMLSLEPPDFSMNRVLGKVPQSISLLSSLSTMNSSYNNRSGEIPTGNQLQKLNDPSIYVGNAGLCGPTKQPFLGDLTKKSMEKTQKHQVLVLTRCWACLGFEEQIFLELLMSPATGFLGPSGGGELIKTQKQGGLMRKKRIETFQAPECSKPKAIVKKA